jgi:hypothetical protein
MSIFQKTNFMMLVSSRTFSRIDIFGLGGTTLFAFLLRLWRAANGLPYLHHWDEHYVAFRSLEMFVSGDLNPHYFHYGSLQMYLLLGIDWVHSLSLKALPETSLMAITDANPLAYGEPTGFGWYLSHPSFLFWNRVLTAVLGALTVAIIYYLGLRLANRFSAVASALLLAGTLEHVRHSAFVTTDIPMGFFVWAAVLFSFLFHKKSELKYLLAALVMSGLAVSIKYNAGMVMLVPVLVLLLARKDTGYRTWHWLLIPIIPGLVFFLTTPYALIDLATFVEDVRFDLLSYSVYGKSGATVEPGLAHMLYQGGIFLENIGIFAGVLALIGLVKVLGRKPFGWIILAFQLFYFLFLTQMRISYHRNFLVLYPMLALLFGLGIAFVVDLLLRAGRVGRYAKTGFLLAVTMVVMFFSLTATKFSWRSWHRLESRTQAILKVNQILADTPGASVGIAAELRLHPQDLANLEAEYIESPVLELLAHPGEYDLIMVFGEANLADHDTRDIAREINGLLGRIPDEHKEIIGSGSLNFRIYSVDPAVLLLSDPPALDEIFNP